MSPINPEIQDIPKTPSPADDEAEFFRAHRILVGVSEELYGETPPAEIDDALWEVHKDLWGKKTDVLTHGAFFLEACDILVLYGDAPDVAAKAIQEVHQSI